MGNFVPQTRWRPPLSKSCHSLISNSWIRPSMLCASYATTACYSYHSCLPSYKNSHCQVHPLRASLALFLLSNWPRRTSWQFLVLEALQKLDNQCQKYSVMPMITIMFGNVLKRTDQWSYQYTRAKRPNVYITIWENAHTTKHLSVKQSISTNVTSYSSHVA